MYLFPVNKVFYIKAYNQIYTGANFQLMLSEAKLIHLFFFLNFIFKELKIMANRLFLYLLIFGANSLKAQNPIVYLSFDDWPLVKLDGGKLICTDYVNIFTDEFNSSIQFDKNWNKYMGNNPDCGLAHGSGSVFSETNVILDTAAITGGITGQVELYVTKTSTTGDIDCDSNVTNYITREYTGGSSKEC
jgi:hypothetical protein